MATTVIEDKLQAWVAALPDVVTLAGGRVHPFGEVPQNTAWLFVTYYRVMGRRLRHLRGTSGVTHATLQMGAHAQTYAQAKRLADALRIAMDAFGRGDMGGIVVQSMITGDDHDYHPLDSELSPFQGGEVVQPCVSFDVTIWFQEG